MAFQVNRGGVITGLGTNLISKTCQSTLFPANKVPQTIRFNGASKDTLNGLKYIRNIHFEEKFKDLTFAFNARGRFDRQNPLKTSGFQLNRSVLSTSTDLFRKQPRLDRYFSTLAEELELKQGGSEKYRVVLPLTTAEKCSFTLSDKVTVKEFKQMVRDEDPAVKSLVLYDDQGIRVSDSTRIADVLSKPFLVLLNEKKFSVKPAANNNNSNQVGTNNNNGVSDVGYDELKQKLIPLYLKKKELDDKAENQANLVMFAGLGYLLVQMGVLARFTWWEFNWDIMEPVTYFVTFGTAVLGYFYFAVTRREYTFTDIRENILKKRMFQSYIRHGFPIEEFYTLEHKLKTIDPEAVNQLVWEVNEGLHADVKPTTLTPPPDDSNKPKPEAATA